MARHNEQGNNSNVLSMISIALILKLDDTVTSLSTLLAAQNKFNLFTVWHFSLGNLKQKVKLEF